MEWDHNQINELLFRLLDNEISDQDFAKLIAWLNSGREAKVYYYRFMGDYSALSLRKMTTITENADPDDSGLDLNLWKAFAECEKTAPAVEIPKEEIDEETGPVIRPPKEKRPISKFQIFTLVMSAAAMLFFALFIKFVPEPLPSVEVATLVDQMNVQWGDPAVDLKNGNRLLTNDYALNLKKGMVSIAYDKGVDVVVESPALFEIERSGIYLEYGRLYSRVSETGTGFTVNTSTSQFVDMGTEFGVKAEIDGSSEVHVTKGKVQLFAGASGKSKTGRMVTENQAVRYSAESGRVRDIRVKRNAFVRKINSAINRAWMGPSSYELAVLKTNPLHYWRFDGDQQGLLRNEMNPQLNDQYRSFGSLGYSNGPDLGAGKNAALQLTGSQDDYAILRECTDETDNADGFTIATWVRPEKAYSASKNNIIMRFRGTTGQFVGGGRSLWFDEKNRFGVYLISDEQAESQMSQRSVRSDPVAVNRWHHVVVAYTKNDRVSLYVNGRLEASERIIGSIHILTKDMQWCIGSAYSKTRGSFEGSIDEICHYNRELSAEEVRMLYEAVGQR